MLYTIPFQLISTGVVADTYKTMVAALVPDTAGLRCRLRHMFAACSDVTPPDSNMLIQFKRIFTFSGGDAGTGAGTVVPAKVDTLQLDTTIVGKTGYTGEPTSYEAVAPWQHAMHTHDRLDEHFDPTDDRFVIPRDCLGSLLIAPIDTTAIKMSGHIIIEVH